MRSPVLSRDGTLIAFAAVAEGYSNPQVWVGRADGSGRPRPLTSGTAHNYDPEFSSDGRYIYFTSDRKPQGIYRVPSIGGEPELFIENAYAAKISPDGLTLLYGNNGRVFKRDLSGETATLLLPDLSNSYAPVWSPDGSRILAASSTNANRDPDWWLVPAAGGEPRKTTIGDQLRQQGFNYVGINAFVPADYLVFTGKKGETQTLWKVQLGADGRLLNEVIPATNDPEGDSDATYTAGKLVFARTRVDMNFWALPLDASAERIMAPPQALTSSPGQKGQQSAAGDRLLYSGQDEDRFSLFLKRRNQSVAEQGKKLGDGFYSLLSPDGASYVYGDGTKENLNISLKSLSWWPFWPSRVCDRCGMPRQFSKDGSTLLMWVDSWPTHAVELLDVHSRRRTQVVSTAQDLKAPTLAPDGKWTCFVTEISHGNWQAMIAPVAQNRPTDASQWVPVTAVSDRFFLAFWSSHPDLIYILSSHGQGGNLRYLDAQRLDETRHPVGDTIPVYEFNEPLVPTMDPIWNNIMVEGNRIIIELGSMSSNVWIR